MNTPPTSMNEELNAIYTLHIKLLIKKTRKRVSDVAMSLWAPDDYIRMLILNPDSGLEINCRGWVVEKKDVES